MPIARMICTEQCISAVCCWRAFVVARVPVLCFFLCSVPASACALCIVLMCLCACACWCCFVVCVCVCFVCVCALCVCVLVCFVTYGIVRWLCHHVSIRERSDDQRETSIARLLGRCRQRQPCGGGHHRGRDGGDVRLTVDVHRGRRVRVGVPC